MKRILYIFLGVFILLSFSRCVDHIPGVQELPSPDVDFRYTVIDPVYQLDYYVGATVEFVSVSAAEGEAQWDFGDGTTAIGGTVTHKYAETGTYEVRLTINGVGYTLKPIYISDIKPILELNPIPNNLCEVLITPVSFKVTLPNPETLTEEYNWIFPEGTRDANGNLITTFAGKDPGAITFSNVGSQSVRLQVKLGGRVLEEGLIKVPVAYNSPVPTLYFAVKTGNIMALKLADEAPTGMKIMPFDMGVKSGQHALNILFNDTSLYILDPGKQFTFVNDVDGVLGDGRITVMSKDGKKVETMLTNNRAAFDDPFYGYIEGSTLYFSDRNTGIRSIGLKERNRSLIREEFPYFVENARIGYYNLIISYGSMNAGFGKVNNVWYWCKTFNGLGIMRFTDADILQKPLGAGEFTTLPESGFVLEGKPIKSFVWDSKNAAFYFTTWDTGMEGLYRCTLDQLKEIKTNTDLAQYKLKLANGKTVTPIAEAGKGEGASGEFIGISQLALDEATGNVYFGLRSADATVKSGLMRYNASTKFIEHVIEGVEVYGVAVNKAKTKLF